jgi:vacuolar-type H+-ATPase subunit E/Vma4
MALDDIIKSIAKDAQVKIADVNKQGDELLAVAEKEWQTKVETKKGQVLSHWQSAVEKKISQSVLKLKADSQNKVLLEKQSIIEQVFEQSLTRLGELPEDQYVDLLAKLIDNLPDTDGSLASVQGKTKLLKQALDKSSKKFEIESEEVDGQGGFILKAKDFSVDNRFVKLLENNRDELRVEVGKILFS